MARCFGTGIVRRASLVLASLGASATAQTTFIRERFVLDDVRDPFERTLGEEDAFGSALAGLGDLNGDGLNELAVGAPHDNFDEGAVWIFSMRPSRQIAKFVKLGPAEALPFALDFADRFGSAVVALGDLDGNGVGDLAVGAPGDDDGVLPPLGGAGAVYVLFLNANGTVSDYRKFSRLAGGFAGKLDPDDHFGAALAAPGDLDGNGVPDLLVGAPGDDDGLLNAGAVWVLFFAADRSVQAELKLDQVSGGMEGALTASEGFGNALAMLGDLDGDGVGDLAVGSVRGGGSPTEKLRVLFLASDSTVSSHVQLNGLGGRALAALGDVDGDGVEDLAANTRVVLLNADGSVKSSASLAPPPYQGFGAALAAPGDTNSDGRPDLVVGSPGADVRLRNSGAISFCEINADGSVDPLRKDVDAPSSGLPLAPQAILSSDVYGAATAPVGDLDNNGLAEVAVGAPEDDDGATNAGAVWIHFIQGGSGHRVEKISATQGLLPLDAGDQFGSDIAGLGDLDGNGAEDLAVSAALDDDSRADGGAVYVLFLAQNGAVQGHQKISGLAGGFSPPANLFHFGAQIEALGDLDGDGRTELAVASLSSFPTPDNVWVLFLNADGTVRQQTLLDRALVPNLGTTFGRSLANLGAAPGGRRYLVAGGTTATNSVNALWRLTLDATGQIQETAQLLVVVPTTFLSGLGDLNGDGVADLASTRGTGSVEFRFLRADFTVLSSHSLGGNGLGSRGLSALGDLTGDGLPDLAFGGVISGHDRVLLLSLDGNVKWGFEHQDTADAAPLENGRQIPRPHPGRTFVISSEGANLGATAFDSTPGGPNLNNDLLVDRGNVLILQDSLSPTQSTPGLFDHPTDDPDGGLFAFDFPRLVRPLSIELADLDPFPYEGATVTLIDAANRTRLYDVPAGWTGLFGSTAIRKLDLTTLAPQPGAGPYPAEAFNTPGFDARRVVRIEVELFDGGALDDLAYDPYP